MGAAFYDEEQKRMKLDRTICLYKGNPVFIRTDTNEDYKVVVYPLGNPTQPIYVDYRDDDFDYLAFPLGYTNWRGAAYYVSRLPERQNAQGLAAHCVCVRPRNMPGLIEWHSSTEASNTIKGIYPTLDVALDTVSYLPGKPKSVAFSRYFAIECVQRGIVTLNYRGRNVGVLENREFKKFRVNKSKDLSLILIAAKRVGVDNVST